VDDLEKKAQHLRDTIENFVYSPEVVAQMLQNTRTTTYRNLVMERAKLCTLRDSAKESDDSESVVKLSEQIAEIDRIAKERKKESSKGPSVNNINKKNRTANFLTSFVQSKAGSQENAENPFLRRPTKPTLMWQTFDQGETEMMKEKIDETTKLTVNSSKSQLKSTETKSIKLAATTTINNINEVASPLSQSTELLKTEKTENSPTKELDTGSSLLLAHNFEIEIDVPDNTSCIITTTPNCESTIHFSFFCVLLDKLT